MAEDSNLKKLFIKFLNLSPSYLREPIVELYIKFYCPLIIGPIRYLKFRSFLNESQWWPFWKLKQYQEDRLGKLLRYACLNVPYYNEIFRKNNIIPNDIKTIADLKKIPILTKENIAKNLDKLVSKKANRRHLELVSTSGSTGKPLQFYRDKNYVAMGRAYADRQARIMNLDIYGKYIHLWARPFVEKGLKDIRFYEPHFRRLSLSAVPVNTNRLGEYIEIIRKFSPGFVSGNPSFLYNLACYAQENNITDIKFRYFSSYFENIFPYQKELIEKQFSCEVYSYYNSEERLLSAADCSRHEGMHIHMERGILEIVDENDVVLPDGHSGRMIVTGLYNFAMPFIRYDIGDIGAVSERPCSCGRGLPLLKSLDGRSNEVIRYKDKTIYSTTLSFLLWKFKNIKECQFIQERENEIKVNIVKRNDYSDKDTLELTQALKELIDENLNININFLDCILRSRMGKFPFVISRIKTR